MRLIKLAAYISLGYLVYEFIEGLTHGPRQGRMSPRANRRVSADPGRMNVTGPSHRGRKVSIEDSQGARSNRIVGRGVVAR